MVNSANMNRVSHPPSGSLSSECLHSRSLDLIVGMLHFDRPSTWNKFLGNAEDHNLLLRVLQTRVERLKLGGEQHELQ